MTEEDSKPVEDQGALNGGRPYTLEALAERWECSAPHVRRLCTAGKLRHFKIGTLYRVPVDAVLEFETGHYGEEKAPATATVSVITPTDKDDPVAAYIRSYRDRTASHAGAPILPVPPLGAKED